MKQLTNPRKSYREQIPSEWAEALLSSPPPSSANGTPAGGGRLWDALQDSRKGLGDVVAEANAALNRNPLTPLVAAFLAKQSGRRGDASLSVDADGSVFLEIRYVGAEKETPVDSGHVSLTTLRVRAEALGIDVSGMGRSKRKIKEAIAAAGTPAAVPAKPKRVKTAPSVTPPTVFSPPPPKPPPPGVTPPAVFPAPVSAPAPIKGNGGGLSASDFDLLDDDGPSSKEEPPRPTPLTHSGKSLSEVARDAESAETDLDTILTGLPGLPDRK